MIQRVHVDWQTMVTRLWTLIHAKSSACT